MSFCTTCNVTTCILYANGYAYRLIDRTKYFTCHDEKNANVFLNTGNIVYKDTFEGFNNHC